MAKKLTDYNLSDLYDWIEMGQPPNVPQEFATYVDLLDKIRGMLNRIDKFGSNDVIVNHLVTFEPGLKGNRIRATEMISEALEYFYSQKSLSKKAWCLWYATQLEKAYNLAIAIAKNTNDIDKATKILERSGKFRDMAESTELQLPDDMFKKPIKIYSMDMSLMDRNNEDRQAIEMWLDENVKDVPLKTIEAIKQEALINPVKIFKDEDENPRKS